MGRVGMGVMLTKYDYGEHPALGWKETTRPPRLRCCGSGFQPRIGLRMRRVGMVLMPTNPAIGQKLVGTNGVPTLPAYVF